MTKNEKFFRSASGGKVRISNLKGHVAIIGKAWRHLPLHLHTLAYQSGCVSNDMDAFKNIMTNPERASAVRRDDMIDDEAIDIIKEWIADKKHSNFTSKRNPNALKLSNVMGVRVSTKRATRLMETLRSKGYEVPKRPKRFTKEVTNESSTNGDTSKGSDTP